jgi:acyl-CoA synthetase (AMP-forming)/AMP-acid ligase II
MTTEAALRDNLIHRVNVGDMLTRTAARYPERTALVDGERRLTYRGFDTWVNRVANGLAGRGYRPGDALALASGNSAEFLVTYFACAKLGVVCTPINLGWRTEEVAYVLGHSEARGMVVESGLIATMAPALDRVSRDLDLIVVPRETKDAGSSNGSWLTFEELAAGAGEAPPEFVVGDRDPISYLYTSGTTSFPKGVVGNHLAIYLESMSMALEARFAEDDRFVAMMPMFHTAQLNTFCTPAVMVGAAIHVLRKFDPAVLLELIERERITQIFGLPMMYRAMLDHPDLGRRDLSSLRRAAYAMAPMPDADLRRALDAFGCDFDRLFGQTEMSPTTTLFRPEHQLTHTGAVGTPIANIQIGIMGPDGELLPQGEEGEIVYRGPQTLTRYLKDPDATEAAFARGWFHSGDVGRFDADGLLWFSDRYKDVIKTGGENVASIEVEKELMTADPGIAEAVVVGLPHERWSEAITAVVVPRSGAEVDEERIIGTLKQRLDGYKVPKSVILVEELPRTSTGKIQKNVLRERFADHYQTPG